MQDNINNTMTSQTNNLNIKKQLKDKINFEALFTGMFAVIAVLFSAFVMSGFRFDSDIFTSVAFYISTIINFGIMIFTYSFVKALTIKKLKLAKNTEYYNIKLREERYIKKVRDEHLEELIEERIYQVNNQRRIAAANLLLQQITYGLTYNDIIDLDNENNIAINKKLFNEFCDKRDLSKKKKKELRKTIFQVINGKFKYAEIKVKEILNDISVDKQFADVYSIDERKLNIQETKKKSLMFLFSTAITNAIIWNGLSPAFWAAILTQTVLILTSTLSATMVANQRISTLSMVSNNKCGFLNEVLQDDKIRIYKEKRKREIIKQEQEEEKLIDEAIEYGERDHTPILEQLKVNRNNQVILAD